MQLNGRGRKAGLSGGRRSYSSVLLAGVCLGALAEAAQAQSVWNGSLSTNWFTAGNWTPSGVPGSGTSVQINTIAPNATVVGAAGAQANQLTLGANVGQTGNLTVTGVGSTLSLTNNVGFFLVGDFGTGNVTVSNGATLTTFTAAIGNQTGSTGTVTVTGANSQWNLTPLFAFHVGSSGTGTLDILDGGQVTSSIFGMDLGVDNGASGTVTVSGTGSKLTVPSTTNIGSAAGGTGVMQADSGGLLALSTVTVGLSGQGTLNLLTGADLTASGQLTVGSAAQGDASFDGAGTTAAVTGALRIGLNSGGVGTLDITDGAVVTSGSGQIGTNTGATGVVNVTGTDARWNVTGAFTNVLTIGQSANSGTGELHILDGGRVDAAGFVGHNSAVVEVDGAGSQLNLVSFASTTTTFRLGGSGLDNRLDVTDGATLATRVADLTAAAGAGVTANIAGADTTWNATAIRLGGAGLATMIVDDGAGVQANGDFIVDGAATTSLTLTGGAHVVQDAGPSNGAGQFRLGVDGHGTLLIEDGAVLDTFEHPDFIGFTFLARNAGSTATATVTGAGSEWNTEGLVNIGNQGAAALDLLDGASMTGNGSVRIGFVPGSSGDVLVSGPGTSWVVTPADELFDFASILVGVGGTGTMQVEDGAHVAASGIGVGSSFVDFLGNTQVGGTGSLVVTGPGTTVDLNLGDFSSFDAGGDGGTGTIDVLDGAVVTVAGQGHFGASTIFIGSDPEQLLGHGTLTVDGPGSRVTYTQTLDIGEQATGVLNITDGGFVSNSDGYLGSFTNAVGSAGVGTATVTGAGSRWENSGFLRVGDQGTGTLDVLAGGFVSNTSAVIANATGSIGDATVSGAGSTWTSTGALGIGNLGTASLTIADGGLVNSGAVSINALSRLDIGGGGAAGTLNAPSVANAGLIRFNHTGTTTFGAAISGAGTVVKDAAGTTVLSAVNGYTGATTVNAGSLLVNGSIAASAVTVNAGGTLGGTGTVGTTTVAADGTLAPGASIGTLNISGNLTVADDGTFLAEVAPASADLASISGTATLDGLLIAQATGGTYVPGQYVLISATGGISGEFENFATVGSFSGLTATLSYDGDQVFLNLAAISGGPVDWAGGTSTDWFTASNWVSNTVPTAADTVTIDTQTPNPTIIDTPGAVSGDIRIGASSGASGNLTIQDGGMLNTDGMAVVGENLGTGEVTVTGAGSTWTVSGLLRIGGPSGGSVGTQGSGTLTIANGGVVTSGSSEFYEPSDGSFDSSVSVTGTGAIWNSGTLRIVDFDSASVAMTVADGGTVNSAGAEISGRVLVTGSGSVWNSGNLTFGLFSTGDHQLTIADGAMVNSADATLGTSLTFDAAQATVTGAGSTWNISGSLRVGEGSSFGSSVAIGDGATVNVADGTGTAFIGTNTTTPTFASLIIGGGAGSGPGTLNAAEVVLGDEALLSFDHNAASYVFAAEISGTGSVFALQGTTILTADSFYAGSASLGTDTTIEAAATLQLGNGGTTGSIVGNVVNRGTLAFNRSNALIFDGVISDAGDLEQNGTGTTTLTGLNTYTGTTTVNDGILLVNGSIADSAVTVNAGGTLGGNGTVGATTVNGGGMIAPGASIGTLHVDGDLTFAAGTTYEVEVDATGAADLIDATGTATISGGTVEVLASPGSYQPSTTYTILTAASVTGAFSGVTSNLAFLTPSLAYDADNVFLTLERNGIDFGDIGGTFNQRSTGGGVESLGDGSTIFDAVVVLDIPGARAAFDQLSGEIHASAKGMLVDDSRFIRDAALDRLRAETDGNSATPLLGYGPGAAESAPSPERFAVWGQAFGAWSTLESDGNAAEFDRSTGGLLLGADALGGETWRIGLLAGFSRSSFDVDDRMSWGDAENYHLGIYGGAKLGPLRLRGGAAHSWHDIDTSRTVAFQGFDDMLSAGYDAGTTQFFAEAGYAVEAGRFSLEPFAGLAHVLVRTDAFVEQGGPAALISAETDTDATFATLGILGSASFALGGIEATARGMVGWRHAFGDLTPLSNLAFAGGDAFAIVGVPIAEDAVVLELGLDLDLAANVSFGASYSGQIAGSAADHAAKAKLVVSF
jgi:outer membrane autotransporter protein